MRKLFFRNSNQSIKGSMNSFMNEKMRAVANDPLLVLIEREEMEERRKEVLLEIEKRRNTSSSRVMHGKFVALIENIFTEEGRRSLANYKQN